MLEKLKKDLLGEENEHWQKIIKEMKAYYEEELNKRRNECREYLDIILFWFNRIHDVQINFNKSSFNILYQE